MFIDATTTSACFLHTTPVKLDEVYLVHSHAKQEGQTEEINMGIGWQNKNGWGYQNDFAFVHDKKQADGWMLAEGVVVVPKNVITMVMKLGIPRSIRGKVFFDDATVFKLRNDKK